MSDQIDRNRRIDVTVGMLRDLVKDIGVFVKEKLDPLEARIAALEAREYKGIWTGTETYAKGAMVTHSGGLWIARSDSLSVRPGTSPAWQLCVRRGRDGKDARSDATLQR